MEGVTCPIYSDNETGCFFFFNLFYICTPSTPPLLCTLYSTSGKRKCWSVPRFYITLHKAEQRKLISPNLYSQKLKIYNIKASKWLLSIKGQRWSPEHHNTTHSFGKNRSAGNNLARGRMTRGLLSFSNHTLYSSSV